MIKKFINNLYKELIAPPANKNHPIHNFWVGSNYGIIVFILLIGGIIGYNYQMGIPPGIMMLAGITLGFIGLILFSLISSVLSKLFRKLPQFFYIKLLGALGLFILVGFVGLEWPKEILYEIGSGFLLYILLSAVFTGSIYTLITSEEIKKSVKYTSLASALISSIFIFYGLFLLGYSGENDNNKSYRHLSAGHGITINSLPNPANSGNFKTEYFTYGSGNDVHRSEFKEKARFISPVVNASNLLPNWQGETKKWREEYWKFGVESFPLNARVWMPLAKDKSPLILIVHGNHNMEDYSDEGYSYLAELLSSRGFITASVDENFLNGTWAGDFKGKEMPARAWLLLKHLELWKTWNNNPKHPFYNKIDMENIILLGHSRGGEAVAIAAKFNELSFFPDNANEKFNFNFGIKGIIALAPTDYRYERNLVLNNINYLTLHGSYDNEVTSFYGLRQYKRINIDENTNRVKSGIYIHRANHVNFNSKWSKRHLGLSWILNKKPLLNKLEQKQAAKVFISAFSEFVFNNRKEYLKLFQNTEFGKEWIPPTLYLNNYQDDKSNILLDFEHDIDLTKDKEGIEITASYFKIWREEELRTRDGDSQKNNALVLGWNKKEYTSPAKYSIWIPGNYPFKIDSTSYLLISAAAGDINELIKNEELKTAGNPDFSIELEDNYGNKARIVLSKIKKIAPRLKVQVLKSQFLNEFYIGNPSETNLETFIIPLNEFKSNRNFNPSKLSFINIIFDQVDQGVVVLDDIGFGQE